MENMWDQILFSQVAKQSSGKSQSSKKDLSGVDPRTKLSSKKKNQALDIRKDLAIGDQTGTTLVMIKSKR